MLSDTPWPTSYLTFHHGKFQACQCKREERRASFLTSSDHLQLMLVNNQCYDQNTSQAEIKRFKWVAITLIELYVQEFEHQCHTLIYTILSPCLREASS